METPIVLTQVSEAPMANKIRIGIKEYKLKEYAIITVYFMLNDYITKAENIKIEGEDFSNWGTDDDYIVNYVLNYYGKEKIT